MVFERFPSQFPWEVPAKDHRSLRGKGPASSSGYAVLTCGLVQCSHCHVNVKHTLRWPEDAYWQWTIHGQVLWAWDRSHAEAILAFIAAAHRSCRRSADLRRLPAHFLNAKVRSEVVRKIKQRLEEMPGSRRPCDMV